MEKVFRPRSNFGWAFVAFMLISLFALNSMFFSQDMSQTIIELAMSTAMALATYLIWIRPRLVIGNHAVVVVNPLKTETINFVDIMEIETKWALTIVHSRGKTTAWVAPASGKRRWIASQTFRWYGSSVPLSGADMPETGAMSASLDSYSGQAAYLIREQMKRSH